MIVCVCMYIYIYIYSCIMYVLYIMYVCVYDGLHNILSL